jgi:hypothetical protein
MVRPIACLLLGACAAAPPQSGFQIPATREPQGWLQRGQLDVFVAPVWWTKVETEDANGREVDVESEPGFGAGLRIGAGSAEDSVGLLYAGALLDEEDGTADLQQHALYADFEARVRLQEAGGAFWLRAGGGLGAAWSEFDAAYEDQVGGAIALRLMLDFRPKPGFGAWIGAGGFLQGYPGETQAWGSMLLFGGTLDF